MARFAHLGVIPRSRRCMLGRANALAIAIDRIITRKRGVTSRDREVPAQTEIDIVTAVLDDDDETSVGAGEDAQEPLRVCWADLEDSVCDDDDYWIPEHIDHLQDLITKQDGVPADESLS